MEKNVSDLTLEDAESFLTAKRLEGRSPETHNHYRSAIKFLYRKVLKILWDDDTVPAMKRERNLPAVLSRDEINAIIDATPNLKHKAIIATMYSSGLRVSEVVHLHYDGHFTYQHDNSCSLKPKAELTGIQFCLKKFRPSHRVLVQMRSP